MTLRKPKKQKGGPPQKKTIPVPTAALHVFSDNDIDDGEESDTYLQVCRILLNTNTACSFRAVIAQASIPSEQILSLSKAAPVDAEDVDLNDPSLTIPLVRYNAMLAVLRNTLYMYGSSYLRF